MSQALARAKLWHGMRTWAQGKHSPETRQPELYATCSQRCQHVLLQHRGMRPVEVHLSQMGVLLPIVAANNLRSSCLGWPGQHATPLPLWPA